MHFSFYCIRVKEILCTIQNAKEIRGGRIWSWESFNNNGSICYCRFSLTVCPGSSEPIYIVTYYIKWVTTSWTDDRFKESKASCHCSMDESIRETFYLKYFYSIFCLQNDTFVIHSCIFFLEKKF